MKKILFSLLLLSSFLNAEIITNVSLLDTKNKCIYNDYYNKGGSFHYRYLTSNNTWRSTTSKKYSLSIINSYQFDTNTSICSPSAWRVMGMTIVYFTLFFHPFHSKPSTFLSLKQASKIVA